MAGTSCVILLIGEETAERKWIKHEIKKGWDDKKGLVGIYVHNLPDRDGRTSSKGRNPFEDLTVTIGEHTGALSSMVKAYDPPHSTSEGVYAHIKTNLKYWVEEAVCIQYNYSFGRVTSCSLERTGLRRST